jgi:hypothetical protein
MQDDFASLLTQEVKEEVIENYLYARRLVQEQIDYVNELAEQAAQLQEKLYRRFARMYDLLSRSEFVNQFVRLVQIKRAPFMDRFGKDPNYRKGLRLIKIRGLTNRARFKRLLLASYHRLFTWNEQYKEAYENLQEESKATDQNLKKFEKNHDLLAILSFLKDMDIDGLEKKHFLGDNFTPEELASVEKSLRFKPIRMEQLKLIFPPGLPKPRAIQRQLADLASCVFGDCSDRVRSIMK